MSKTWLLAAVGLVGCVGELTEAVVVTDTNLAIPSQMDAIRYEIDATQIGDRVHTARLDLGPDTVLPVTLTLVHDEGPLGPVIVTAEGTRGDEVIVRRRARFSFVRGRSLVVELDLTDACVARDCGADQTCVDGACRGVDVVPDGGGPTADAGGGRPADAGGGGPMDTGPPSCQEGCDCSQECASHRCECREGCTCALACSPDGDDCHEAKCDGSSTTCTYALSDASNAKAKCEHGATCDIDARDVSNLTVDCTKHADCQVSCESVSNCYVHCTNGATCVLSCRASSNCEFEKCDGTVTTCRDGTLTCNRGC